MIRGASVALATLICSLFLSAYKRRSFSNLVIVLPFCWKPESR